MPTARLPFPAPMVVTTPTSTRIALIAVDGLTHEILESRPGLLAALPSRHRHPRHLRQRPPPSAGPPSATGVTTEHHGVRAIEGVRFRGGAHVLQRISRGDFVLMTAAPAIGIARREPLPPTVRRRDYIWEIFAARGLPSLSVNWWATADARRGALHEIGPESIFTAGSRGTTQQPLEVDATAIAVLTKAIDDDKPRFATVYLPALDVILNRIELDPAARLASSLRALDGIQDAVAQMRARGYDVVLVGAPGDWQGGSAVLASTIALPVRILMGCRAGAARAARISGVPGDAGRIDAIAHRRLRQTRIRSGRGGHAERGVLREPEVARLHPLRPAGGRRFAVGRG